VEDTPASSSSGVGSSEVQPVPGLDAAQVEDTSAGSSGGGSEEPAGGRTASPYAMRPWLEYEELSKCPTWYFGSSPPNVEGHLPEPRPSIRPLGGATCQVPLGPRVRVVFAGQRGKSAGGDNADEELDALPDWRQREALRNEREDHHNILVSEVMLQLRCRVGAIDVKEEDESDRTNDETTTRLMLHPLPFREPNGVGLYAAHKVLVSGGGIAIWAGTREAVAYAITSLISTFAIKTRTDPIQWMQMPPVDVSRRALDLQCAEYDTFDGAALSYRGLMVDVARHFLPIEELVRIMHVMSMLKLNVLHLHLSDDQGWRLGLSEFPELNDFGSRRGRNVNSAGSKYRRVGVRSNLDGSEWYNRMQTHILRRVARLLHITLVPEIDVPAHSAALIRAAQAAGQSDRNHGTASIGALSTLDGVVEVHEGCVEQPCESGTPIGRCPSNLAVNCMGGTHGLLVPTSGTVAVVQRVIDATLRQHFPSSPYLHIGGDETSQFSESKIMTPSRREALRDLWSRNGEAVTLSTAHGRFLAKLQAYARDEHRRTPVIWDDSMHTLKKAYTLGNHVAADDALLEQQLPVVQWWRDWSSESRWDTFRRLPVLKILSPTSNTYLDASQHAHREEDKYPVQDGTVTINDVWKLSTMLTSLETDRVLGVEGCLWSETLVNTSVLWYQLLPRMAALAHIAWTGTSAVDQGVDSLHRFGQMSSRLRTLVESTLDTASLLYL
jgi:hypothetical protein